MKAIWNDQVLADSDDTIVIEGNHYFPELSVNYDFLKPSETHSTCSWKGEASYFNIEFNGAINPDAAWYYPEPEPAASQIRNYVAFWKGVEITN